LNAGHTTNTSTIIAAADVDVYTPSCHKYALPVRQILPKNVDRVDKKSGSVVSNISTCACW